MFRLRVLALAGAALACTVLFAQAQEEAELKGILREAIKAHGGEKNLNKYGAATSKFKGTIEIMGQSRDMTGESTLQKPDKIKTSVTVDINGTSIPVVVVYDGKTMWRSVMGKTVEIDDEKVLKEMREGLQAEGAGSLTDFLKSPYELSAIGEVKVKDKAAIGVRVSKKGQRDISFYFDKKTHLVVKTEMRVYDTEAGQEVTQEKYIVGYKDTNGIKSAARIVIEKDSKAFMDIEITETQTFEKLDDATFAKP
jgi:outer membrane lipoprotein-sorting protein